MRNSTRCKIAGLISCGVGMFADTGIEVRCALLICAFVAFSSYVICDTIEENRGN